MLKKTLIGLASVILISGCSSKSENLSKYSVTEATDYAMSCDSLLNEIKVIKAKINHNDNFLESFVPDYLKGTETLTENDILVLTERKKSLQLIYTLKEAKNECRTLTVDDTKEGSKGIVKAVKDVKGVVTEVSTEITN